MSRTHKTSPFNWYNKEKKPFRKTHFRSHRAEAKRAVRVGEEPPSYKRTSGWLTH